MKVTFHVLIRSKPIATARIPRAHLAPGPTSPPRESLPGHRQAADTTRRDGHIAGLRDPPCKPLIFALGLIAAPRAQPCEWSTASKHMDLVRPFDYPPCRTTNLVCVRRRGARRASSGWVSIRASAYACLNLGPARELGRARFPVGRPPLPSKRRLRAEVWRKSSDHARCGAAGCGHAGEAGVEWRMHPGRRRKGRSCLCRISTTLLGVHRHGLS